MASYSGFDGTVSELYKKPFRDAKKLKEATQDNNETV